MPATDGTEATISSQALSLLACFSDGIDEVVLKIAEGLARSEARGTEQPEISAANIVSAGDVLSRALRNSPDVPDDVKPAIDAMLECVTRKAKNRRL